jgi:hypothetical protein
MYRQIVTLSLLGGGVAAAQSSCIVDCMYGSGCWSGYSVQNPSACNVQPELCRIQCEGKSKAGWGAIAYSKVDKISGWSFEVTDKASAENLALRFCVRQGGKKCVVETSFNHLCGSLAADGDIVGWGTAGDKSAAQQRAIAECTHAGGKKCAIEAWACSAPSSDGGTHTPTAPPAPKAIAWGAIAYSAADMGAGWSQGKPDRATAEKEAMAACGQRGKSCVLYTAFNKQCGVLAADGKVTGIGIAADFRAAMQKATDECKRAGGARCVPHIAFCSN